MAMVHRRLHPLVQFTDERFSPRFGQGDSIGMFVEIFLCQHFFVYHSKNEPVHHDRFEYLRYVQIQRKTAKVGGMQVSDPGVQVGFVNFTERHCVTKGIAKADQRIQTIERRAFASFFERKIGVVQNVVESAGRPIPSFSSSSSCAIFPPPF